MRQSCVNTILSFDHHSKAVVLIAGCLLATVAHAGAGPRWVILGDSIMTVTLGDGEAKDLATNQIPQLTNVTIHNVSRGGGRVSTSAWGVIDYYPSIQAWLGGAWSSQLDGVIITLGTNDWAAEQTRLSEFLSDYATIVQAAVSRGIEVVCVSPLLRADESRRRRPPGQWNGADLQTWRTWIHLVCDNRGGQALSGTWLIPSPTSKWMPDGLHLNAQGHAEFARSLVDWMRFLGYWP